MDLLRKVLVSLLAAGLLFCLAAARGHSVSQDRSPWHTPVPARPTSPVKTQPSKTPQTSPTPQPARTARVTLGPADPAGCVPAGSSRTLVSLVRVIDGDTIEVEQGGRKVRVRYIGLDAPETSSRTDPFEQAAKQKNLELLQGKKVRLVKDVSETDPYGRLLRYIFADQVFVNAQMVRLGYARADSFEPDTACAETFAAAEAAAQKEKIGLWATLTATPGEASRSGSSIIQAGKDCDPAYPTVCIPPPPPDLDCGDVSDRRFQVNPPDPHHFDGDRNGLGCER